MSATARNGVVAAACVVGAVGDDRSNRLVGGNLRKQVR